MVSAPVFISYLDILTLALANSSMSRFDPDIMEWHVAVFEIWERYKNEIPEFAKICFVDDRPPLPPMSDQVCSLRSVLARSGELYMPRGIKNKMITHEEVRLAKYQEKIKGMASILEKHLKIRYPRGF